MWSKLSNKKPFFALAPMADVTDYAFRSCFVEKERPDVLWTEFVSADGLVHSPEVRKRIQKDLFFGENERPIVAQIFTGKPEVMREAVNIITSLGFDGVDINMGCPDRSVEKQGAGAICIKDPARAVALIQTALEEVNGAIPVSVKTRLGYSTKDMGWIRTLLMTGISALTIHLRTRNEMSKVPAHWEQMYEIVAMRNEISPKTVLIGNGDVESRRQGIELAEQYGVEGIMVGRGAFGNPWFFSDYTPNIRETLEMLVFHIHMFEQYVSHKNFAVMKKHFKAYVKGFDGALDLRIRLMETATPDQAREVLRIAILEM